MVTECFFFKIYSHLQSLGDIEFVPYLTKIFILCIKVLLKEVIKSFVLLTFWKNLLLHIVLCLLFEEFVGQTNMFHTKSLFQRIVKIAKSLVKRLKFFDGCGRGGLYWFGFFPFFFFLMSGWYLKYVSQLIP